MSVLAPRRTTLPIVQPSRFFSTFRPRKPSGTVNRRPVTERTVSKPHTSEPVDVDDEEFIQPTQERPAWQIQKAALREKLGGEAWNPRKKLSPDTMDGIRHLHSTQPDKFTTPILAEHFKVSSEAIRRILKSKWRPSDEEHEARMRRWDKRGERIWSNLVEMGVKPPKVWRDMGVGRSNNGDRPKWKGRRRVMADVKDSAGNNFVVEEGDIIPTVGGPGRARPASISLTERL